MDLPELRTLTDQIISEGSKIVSENNPTAEDAIDWLLTVKAWADETIERLKENMALTAEKDYQNFTGLKGNKVQVQYRAFGAMYKLNENFDPERDYDPALMSRKETYSLNSKAVENVEREVGELPPFISKCERPKTITIKKIA